MAENKPIVESIKIGTLEKQIEILEQLGLTRSEITNLIYDTQGQITAENTDTLDIILEQFAKLLEQDELKTIEELARTLLANQSDASVRYVLQHELVGDVLKYILKSSNTDFSNKTITQIMSNKDLFEEVYKSQVLFEILKDSSYWIGITMANSFDIILNNRKNVGKIIEHDSLLRDTVTSSKDKVEKILMKYGHVFYTFGPLNDDVYPAIKSVKRCISPLSWFSTKKHQTPQTHVTVKHKIENTYSVEKRVKLSEWSLTRFYREYPHFFTGGYIQGIRVVPASFNSPGGYGVFLKDESDLANVEMFNKTKVMTYAAFKSQHPEIA